MTKKELRRSGRWFRVGMPAVYLYTMGGGGHKQANRKRPALATVEVVGKGGGLKIRKYETHVLHNASAWVPIRAGSMERGPAMWVRHQNVFVGDDVQGVYTYCQLLNFDPKQVSEALDEWMQARMPHVPRESMAGSW